MGTLLREICGGFVDLMECVVLPDAVCLLGAVTQSTWPFSRTGLLMTLFPLLHGMGVAGARHSPSLLTFQ